MDDDGNDVRDKTYSMIHSCIYSCIDRYIYISLYIYIYIDIYVYRHIRIHIAHKKPAMDRTLVTERNRIQQQNL